MYPNEFMRVIIDWWVMCCALSESNCGKFENVQIDASCVLLKMFSTAIVRGSRTQ